MLVVVVCCIYLVVIFICLIVSLFEYTKPQLDCYHYCIVLAYSCLDLVAEGVLVLRVRCEAELVLAAALVAAGPVVVGLVGGGHAADLEETFVCYCLCSLFLCFGLIICWCLLFVFKHGLYCFRLLLSMLLFVRRP